jgi:hypothetical protein
MKILLILLIVLVWIFLASFLFNHFNSWIGIAIAIGGVATSIYYLENKFKNQQKK